MIFMTTDRQMLNLIYDDLSAWMDGRESDIGEWTIISLHAKIGDYLEQGKLPEVMLNSGTTRPKEFSNTLNRRNYGRKY